MTDIYYNPEPTFRIEGQQVSFSKDAVHLEVEETTEGLKRMVLWLLAQGPTPDEQDEDLNYLDGKKVDFGKSIEVSLGNGDDARTVFKGMVSAMEADLEETGYPHVRVFAEDKLMRLRMTRRSKTYEKKSDADIARDIAGFHNLSPQVEADGPTYDYVQQWNQSDLAFLRERARLIQAEVWVRDDNLYFQTRGNRTATSVTLVQGNKLVAAQLRADLAHQRSQATVSGYDASARDKLSSDAGVDAVSAEASSGRTGLSILSNAFNFDSSKGQGVSYRVRENPLTSGEADAWAKAEELRRARAFVTVVGLTNGSPDLEVGSKVTLSRVGRPFNGDGYYVTQVRHVWDRTAGFKTHFQAERPTLQEAS